MMRRSGRWGVGLRWVVAEGDIREEVVGDAVGEEVDVVDTAWVVSRQVDLASGRRGMEVRMVRNSGSHGGDPEGGVADRVQDGHIAVGGSGDNVSDVTGEETGEGGRRPRKPERRHGGGGGWSRRHGGEMLVEGCEFRTLFLTTTP